MSEDEEEKGARSSDDSGSSEDEQNDDDTSDWEIYEYQNPSFGEKDTDKPSVKSAKVSDSVDGLHWELNGTINQLPSNMMAASNSQMKPGKDAPFKIYDGHFSNIVLG